jgi:hypothetical protein
MVCLMTVARALNTVDRETRKQILQTLLALVD